MPPPVTGLVPAGASLRLSKGPLEFVDLSSDGKTILAGSKVTLCVYQVADGKQDWCHATGESADSTLRYLVYNPDGKAFLTGLNNDHLILWDSLTGQPIWVISNASVNATAWSPDSQQLVYSTRDLFLHILNSRTGNPVANIPLVGIPPSVLSWSPDGKMIAAGDDSGQVTVYDALTGQIMMARSFLPAGHLITGLAWSKDSSKIVAGSSFTSCFQDCTPTVGGFLVLADAHSGVVNWQVDVGDPVSSLALSPDGKTLLANAGDKGLKLYMLTDRAINQPISAKNTLGAFWLPDGQGFLND